MVASRREDRTPGAQDVPQRLAALSIKLLLLFASIGLTLAASEAALALLGLYPPEPRTYAGEHENRHAAHFVADDEIGWRMLPGGSFEWEVDGSAARYLAGDEGFRVGGARGPAPGRPRRIVLVGDSFLWGFGVPYEKTCGHLLESALPGVEVDNRAMVGFGLDQIWLTLRRWALPLDPDLVIAGIFLDDFNRSFSAYRRAEGFNKPAFRLAGDALVPATAGDRPGRVVRFLERRSRLFTLLRRADRRLGRTAGAGGWWSLNAAILDAMRRDARQAATPLLFVHIPFREEIPFPALAAYMEEHGARFLDLPPWTKAERQRLFFPRDHHLNAAGHADLAASLELWIRDQMPELGDGGGISNSASNRG